MTCYSKFDKGAICGVRSGRELSVWLDDEAVRKALHAAPVDITGPFQVYFLISARLECVHQATRVLRYSVSLHQITVLTNGISLCTQPLKQDVDKNAPWVAAKECTSRISYTHDLGSMIATHRQLLKQGEACLPCAIDSVAVICPAMLSLSEAVDEYLHEASLFDGRVQLQRSRAHMQHVFMHKKYNVPSRLAA